MPLRRWSVAVGIACIALASLHTAPPQAPAPATTQAAALTLPARLSDRDFWKLSVDLSEPNGTFRSENLVSNEHTFQYVVPDLTKAVKPGGVYLGVAPDQNFTYILATRPRMAFIVDIRRGNLLQHLMYKAIIELSTDRADFVSRLFSKRRPAGLGPGSTATQLFAAFDEVETSKELYGQNVSTIRDHLVRKHGFGLSDDDLTQLEAIYFAFFWDGPGLRYSSSPGIGSGRGFGNSFPTYADLMVQTDWSGVQRSYLATEDAFRTLKVMEERNLIVPVVGNFAGPKALRGVGRYVRERGAVVSAFYVSNVEQDLFQDDLFDAFAKNVATLPLDGSSMFIRLVSSRFGDPGTRLGPDGRASALDPMRAFVLDVAAGRIRSYADVNVRSK